MKWAIEECLKTSLRVAASMCIGPEGNMHGVSATECGIRMAKAGAHVVGINCHFDPFVSLEWWKLALNQSTSSPTSCARYLRNFTHVIELTCNSSTSPLHSTLRTLASKGSLTYQNSPLAWSPVFAQGKSWTIFIRVKIATTSIWSPQVGHAQVCQRSQRLGSVLYRRLLRVKISGHELLK